MNRRQFLVVGASMPFIAGCTGDGGYGGGGDGGGDQQQQMEDGGGGGGQADVTVEMKNTTFNPVKAEVDVGGTVKWVNKDSFGHDVTSAQFSNEAASWEYKKTVDAGQSVTRTFDSKGIYEYYCTIHGKGTMCGVILVGGVTYDGSLPCKSSGGNGGGYNY